MTECTSSAGASGSGGAAHAGESHADAFVRHLVHELRQPLSTIESLAYYLQMVLGKADAKLARQLDRLRQCVQETDWILADAVHFLQIATPYPQLVDLNEFVTALAAEVGGGPRAWLETRLAAEPAIVRIDVDQGRHLVRNLLLFFRNFSRPEPHVDVRTAITPRDVQLEIRVPAAERSVEELESMFQPFSARLPAGSGLALASARRIAETHGGRIEVHGERDGAVVLRVSFPQPD
jgi:signal transduction histidine kinase